MGGDPFSTKNFPDLLGGLVSDAVVETKPWSYNDKKAGRKGLTRFLIGPGNWLLFGQATFQCSGPTEAVFEIELLLSVKSGDTILYTRKAYSRVTGGGFNSPTIIGGISLPNVATVALTYAVQDMTTYTPSLREGSVSANDQIITAISTPSLYVDSA
jgi:hypothetical protein